DDDPRQLLVPHSLADGLEAGTRPDRARPRRHRALDGRRIRAVECAPPEQAEDNLTIVCDNADVPPLAEPARHLGNRLVGATGGRLPARDTGDARAAVSSTLERETVGAPVDFAAGVVVDAREAEAVEPRRGSWAHVSLAVIAIHDHRPRRLELRRRLGV